MEIYQLYECQGEYADYREELIGSYLRKERAEEEKMKAQIKEYTIYNKGEKCKKCPVYNFENYNKNLEYIQEHFCSYCEKMKLKLYNGTRLGTSRVGCENYCVKWDSSYFVIREAEVEE